MLWTGKQPFAWYDNFQQPLLQRLVDRVTGYMRTSLENQTTPICSTECTAFPSACWWCNTCISIAAEGSGLVLNTNLLTNAPINVLPHLPYPTGRRWGFDLILLKNMPRSRGIWSIFTNNRVKIYSPNGGIWSQYSLQGRGIWFQTGPIPTPCPWGGGGGARGNTLIGARAPACDFLDLEPGQWCVCCDDWESVPPP